MTNISRISRYLEHESSPEPGVKSSSVVDAAERVRRVEIYRKQWERDGQIHYLPKKA